MRPCRRRLRSPPLARPTLAIIDMLLPEPLSPTRPQISPRRTARSTPSTRRLRSPARSESMMKSRDSVERIVGHRLLLRSPRIEAILQAVTDEIEAEDRERQHKAGEHAHPPTALGEVLRTFRHHHPEIGRRRPNADAEKGQGRDVSDRPGQIQAPCTMMGLSVLGTRWRNRMRNSLTPEQRAASIYSRCFLLSVSPRISRA